MNEPDYDYVYNQLRKVKNDVSFREKVADWAQHTVYEIYIQIQHKAAQLAFFIISNHPFIDGNKRIGLHVTLIFLELNGVDLKYT